MEITIEECVRQLAQRLGPLSETASLDAQVLVAHHLGQSRSWSLAHPEALLSPSQYEMIGQAIARLEGGEPLPYVLGHWEFYGLDFLVTPDVLIPRPETELLVEKAIQWLEHHPNKRRVVDVGTGSGCIGIAIANHISDVRIVMVDISHEALEVARQNAEKHRMSDRLDFEQADLLIGLPGPFDLVCANLPYIPTQKLARLQVANREPHIALDGGTNGIGIISRLLEETKGYLIAGGMMLCEIEAGQGDQVLNLARQEFPQSLVQTLKDLSAKDRCVSIERPERIVHLCTPQEWLEQRNLAEFRDLSLQQEGFIHCSQPEQIIEVANRYYHDRPEMVVLWIDPARLASEIRWEQAGNTYYPHVYGPINLDAIDAATPLQSGHDAIYRFIFT